MQKGFVFIASSGYDPDKGKYIKDPSLGSTPTFGACMPNVRKQAQIGDSIFVISGKIPNNSQYVIGGFDVAEKIHAIDAYKRFPEHHLLKRTDHQLTGNIIVNAQGEQHFLDNHENFDKRLENYIVGKNPIFLSDSSEIEKGREGTLEILKMLFNKEGKIPRDIVGRMRTLDEDQVKKLKSWLLSLRLPERKRDLRIITAKNESKDYQQYRIQPILF